MRELRVVGLDVDSKRIVCETEDSSAKFVLRVDDRLRAAVRGDRTVSDQTQIDVEVKTVLRPKDIQARIRAGASVDQVAAAAGADRERVERFAHPVLLERTRAAELATAAHPVLADGPSVLTLLETVSTVLVSRGLDPDTIAWDAWRNEDGRWTVQLAWQAGRSDNVAHFRFALGAHGGTVTPCDDTARELVDPDFSRPPLRPVAPLAQLDFEASASAPDSRPDSTPPRTPESGPEQPAAEPEPTARPEPPAEESANPQRTRKAKGKPTVPAWEDVLLGVRSSAER